MDVAVRFAPMYYRTELDARYVNLSVRTSHNTYILIVLLRAGGARGSRACFVHRLQPSLCLLVVVNKREAMEGHVERSGTRNEL